MFSHQKHNKTIASLSSIPSYDQQLPSLGNLGTPRNSSGSRNNLDTSFSNNLPTLGNNKYASPFHDKSKAKIAPDMVGFNQGFGASKLLTSVKPKQETKPRLIGFNAGLKNTPQPMGSLTPQNNISTSFSDAHSQLMKSRSPTNKPPQMAGGLPLSFVHPRRAYAPEHAVQTEPYMDLSRNRSEITGVYQSAAKQLLDVRIEQQPNQRKHPVLHHATSYSNHPQRPMIDLHHSHHHHQQSQPIKMNNSMGPGSYQHIPSYSDLGNTPGGANNKSPKKETTAMKQNSQPTQPSLSDISDKMQDKVVADRLIEAQQYKKRPGRHIHSPTKDRRLDVNDLKDQNTSNNSLFSNLLSPKNSVPKTSTVEASEDFASVISEDKEMKKKKHPKLKLIMEESKSILRSRRDSLDTPRSGRSDGSRRVTFCIEGTKKLHLRTVLWMMTFGTVMLKTASKFIQAKKIQKIQVFNDEYQRNRDILFQFALTNLKEPLLKMAKEKKPLYIVGSKASLNDINDRCMKIHDYIVSTLEGLLLGLNAEKLPQIFYLSLVSLIEKSARIPDFYLTDFELRRLEFTYGGTLRNTNEMRAKLLIGGYVLIRILLQEIIMRPWQLLPGVKMDKVNQRNLVNVGSIFYHALMDIFKVKVLLLKENQSYIPVEDRVKPTKKMAQATDRPVDDGLNDEVLKYQEPSTNEIILGFYSRPMLEGIIKDRFVLYQDIKDCMEDVLEFIYKKVLGVYMENKKYYNDGYQPKKR